MHSERLRGLLVEAEEAFDQLAGEIGCRYADWGVDAEDKDEVKQSLWLARVRQLSRQFGDIVDRLRDVRLQVDLEIEGLR